MAHAARRSRRWLRRGRARLTSARSRRTGSTRCCSRAVLRTRAAIPSCSTRRRPARPRIAPDARRILDEVDVDRPARNAGEVATLVGVGSRGARGRVDERGGRARRARTHAPGALGLVASVTGPVDHVSDGDTVLAISNGHTARLDHGDGLHVVRAHRLLPRRKPDGPLEAAGEALVAFGVAAEDAARGAPGRGLPRAALRRARRARSRDARRAGPHGAVKEYALLDELERRGLIVGVEHDAAQIERGSW